MFIGEGAIKGDQVVKIVTLKAHLKKVNWKHFVAFGYNNAISLNSSNSNKYSEFTNIFKYPNFKGKPF